LSRIANVIAITVSTPAMMSGIHGRFTCRSAMRYASAVDGVDGGGASSIPEYEGGDGSVMGLGGGSGLLRGTSRGGREKK